MIPPGRPEIARFQIELGQKIAAARKQAGLTQSELAHAIGVTRPSIGNIEQGLQSPPLHRLLAICACVGVALPALLDGPAAEGVAMAGTIGRQAQLVDRSRRRVEQVRRDMRKLDDALTEVLAGLNSGEGAG